MLFEWDEKKGRANKVKHGVSFELASEVFGDPKALSVPDDCEMEERWLTLGLVGGIVVLLVVHKWEDRDHEEVIRIISARKATKRERDAYEKHCEGK